MESLRASYRDDDDEEDNDSKGRTQTHLSPPLSPSQHPQQDLHSISPIAENNHHLNGSKQEEFEDADNGNNDEDDEDDADEEEEDPQLPTSEQLPNLQQPSSDETDEEDYNAAPSRKKQKSLASFTSPSPSPSTPAAALPPADATTTTKATKKPKKKTKAVNVWTKSTSRKGKKKTKLAPASNQESSVLITPVTRFPDRSDDSPDMKICLSKVYKAEKVELSDDRLSAGSSKGYRMVRATRGVVEGAWYFEIKVVKLGETGHTRLGWSMEKGDLQASIGYDCNSFGYRDMDGSKVHRAVREKYGEEGYFEGDVVGFYINLPEGGLYAPKPPHFVWYKGNKFAYPADGKEDPPKVVPGSEMSFFKNGVCQGVAFNDLHGGHYYPAASMYTLPNQPNCVVKFNFGPDFEFFPEDFGSRPIPRPMIEVPYQGYDGRVEGVVQNDLCAEEKH